jgi:hypothetical protein
VVAHLHEKESRDRSRKLRKSTDLAGSIFRAQARDKQHDTLWLVKFIAAENNIVTDGHMEISKITASGRFKNLCPTFYARYACIQIFSLRFPFLSNAFSAAAIEGDTENGDNSRQVKHKGFFYFPLFSERVGRYEIRNVHVTVHLLIKHTTIAPKKIHA